MAQMINRIVFAAGGTGGHIYPAIAIADELKKMNDKIDIRFVGAKGRIEEKIVPQCGYRLDTIEVAGFKRSLSLKNISTGFKILKALKDSKQILNDFNPQLVYGTGGFVTGPVLKAALKLGIRAVIEEGNYYPGVTVKLLASKVDKLILNFEDSKKFFKRQDNIAVMSYPVRENLKKYPKDEAAKYFSLSAEKKTLFVFGGSQGARSINSSLLKSYRKLIENGMQIIWQTGVNDFEQVSNSVKENGVKVLKYIDNIDYAYSGCDLVMCRAGISTTMELASFGLPAVFVPFPGASENHQEKNARALVDKNAAEIILDNELDENLFRVVNELINNEKRLVEISQNIKQFADSKSASKIAQMLVEMVNNSKN